MQLSSRILLAAGLGVLGGSAVLAASARPSAVPPRAGTTLSNAAGAAVGSATITLPPKGRPVLHVRVDGLATGAHGVHLHTAGKCEAPSFTSAGPHLNPAGHQHGKDNPAGSHVGDLPNLVVGQNGKGTLSVPMPLDGAALRRLLFDADGTALVVHAKPDDYRTDPSGNSGDRIACGVLNPG